MSKRYRLIQILFVPLLTSCTGAVVSNSVDDFNKAVEYDYSSFKVTVNTEKDEIKITSVYDIKKSSGVYSVTYYEEQYNLIDLSANSFPEAAKTVKTGTYETNKIQFNISSFRFVENAFDKYSFEPGSLTGEISNGKSYLGTTYDCLNLKASFKYATMLTEIKINYALTDGTSVALVINNFK